MDHEGFHPKMRTQLLVRLRDVGVTLSALRRPVEERFAMDGGHRHVLDVTSKGACHRVAVAALIVVSLTVNACGGAIRPSSSGSTASTGSRAPASSSATPRFPRSST